VYVWAEGGERAREVTGAVWPRYRCVPLVFDCGGASTVVSASACVWGGVGGGLCGGAGCGGVVGGGKEAGGTHR